MQQDEI
jgi:hypothetical protein